MGGFRQNWRFGFFPVHSLEVFVGLTVTHTEEAKETPDINLSVLPLLI